MTGFLTAIGLLVAYLAVSHAAEAKPTIRFTGSQGPPVEVQDYDWDVPNDRPLSVGFSFQEDDAERIRVLMQANLNSRLLLEVGDTPIVTPVVKAPMEGRSLDVSVSDKKTWQEITSALNEGE